MSLFVLLSSVAMGTACSAVNVGSEGSDCVLGRFLTGDPGVVIAAIAAVIVGGRDNRGVGYVEWFWGIITQGSVVKSQTLD